MKRLSLVIASVLLVFFLSNCEKEPDRLDSYLVNFATVLTDGTSYKFRLDNKNILIPKEVKDYKGKNGQRVLLNYVPLNGDTIDVRNISDIFTGSVRSEGYPEKLVQDPVKVQSVWVGGDYLNMVLEIEYHSKAHEVVLLQNTASPTIDLYFSHSRGDDPPGYRQMLYASFLLTSIKSSGNTPFRLFINTYDGVREFQLELK